MSKANKENNTSGHIQLDLTYDEVNLLRECMKRTEDYYRGLILGIQNKTRMFSHT